KKLAVTGIRVGSACHRYRPAHMRLAIEFRFKLLSGAARTRPVRTAGLCHEAVDHTMEYDVIVKSILHQFLDAFDMARRKIRTHLDHNLALGGLQCQR